jgi:hypothetical protein
MQPPATSSLLCPNTFLSTMFISTLNICPSISVRDQLSHPNKTAGKIHDMSLYNIIYINSISVNFLHF